MLSTFEKKETINLYESVCSFYVLEELRLLEVDVWKKSQERWKMDLEEFAESFNSELANAMFDYLFLAAFGEGRHSANTIQIPGMAGGRSSAYQEAIGYSPSKNLPILHDYFANYSWPDGYGGDAWGNICKIAISWYKLPPGRFIDSVVDLSHNNGTVFSKGILFDLAGTGHYRAMLDRKFEASLIDWDETVVYPEVKCLVDRAMTLGIIPQMERESSEKRWLYEPIAFGSKILSEPQRFTCQECNQEISFWLSPDEDNEEKYCTECYSQKFVTCWICNGIIEKEESFSHKYHDYCNCCFHEEFSSCESCEGIVSFHEVFTGPNGENLCESCYDEENEEEEDNEEAA